MVRQNDQAFAHLLCYFSNLVGHSKLGFEACWNFNEVFHQIFLPLIYALKLLSC